jgi:hypothetical protein
MTTTYHINDAIILEADIYGKIVSEKSILKNNLKLTSNEKT